LFDLSREFGIFGQETITASLGGELWLSNSMKKIRDRPWVDHVNAMLKGNFNDILLSKVSADWG
jgi:hypothetical protein